MDCSGWSTTPQARDVCCIEVLTQVSAVNRALQGVALGLLDEHVRCCVTDAAARSDKQRADFMVAEASRAIEGLVKS